jgi:hypothetical protein
MILAENPNATPIDLILTVFKIIIGLLVVFIMILYAPKISEGIRFALPKKKVIKYARFARVRV